MKNLARVILTASLTFALCDARGGRKEPQDDLAVGTPVQDQQYPDGMSQPPVGERIEPQDADYIYEDPTAKVG
jgi:hypothetical protein